MKHSLYSLAQVSERNWDLERVLEQGSDSHPKPPNFIALIFLRLSRSCRIHFRHEPLQSTNIGGQRYELQGYTRILIHATIATILRI